MSNASKIIKALHGKKSSVLEDVCILNETDTVKGWLSTGCSTLDIIMGQGLPVGRVTEIHGDPSSGKSLIAAQCAAMAQQEGALVAYADTESAVSKEMMAKIGVNVDDLIYSEPDTIEETFEFFEAVVDEKEKLDPAMMLLIVWDSVAATSIKLEMESEYGKATMGRHAALISQAMRKFTRIIKQMNVCALFLNQVREDIGVIFGDNVTTFGGKAIPFHSSVRVRLDLAEKIKVTNPNTKKGERVVGMVTNATVVKNKVAMPFRKCRLPIYFGSGIDDAGSALHYLIDNGMASTKGGGRYVIKPNEGAELSFFKKDFPTVFDQNWDVIVQLMDDFTRQNEEQVQTVDTTEEGK